MAPRSRTPIDPAGPADPDALAAHAEAIRRLARSLVADDATADDVAQETMRVGLEHPPRAGYPAFAWLSGIARNVVRGLRRGDRRRLARETAAARPDAAPSTADAVVRMAERRRVVDAVLALDEPYRSTIALRWFDGLPPREIARRQGVPVETARTRCKRGLELLRAELDRRHGGDRRAWMAALLPLTRGGGVGLAAGLSSLIGGLLVTTTAKVAMGSVAVLLLVGGAWMTVRGTQGAAQDGLPVTAPSGMPSDAPTTLAARPSARAPDPATSALPTSDPIAVSGRVLGPGGVPVPARIHVVPRDVPASTEGPPTTVAAADGTFTVAVGDATEMRVAATADGFAPVATTARAGVPVELRMRRDRVLALRIVDDAARAPIAGAMIESIEVRGGFEHVARATSDADGNAGVRDPSGPFPDPFAPPRLRVRATGYRAFVLSDTGAGFPRSRVPDRRFEVALSRGPGIAVRVLRPDGTTPAAGVTVRGFAGWGPPVGVGASWRALPHASTDLGERTTAVDGTAMLDAAEANTPLWLVATLPGLRAVRCVREHPTNAEAFDLVLRPTLSISGRVVDEKGAPVAGAMVQVDWRGEVGSSRKDPRNETVSSPPAPLEDRWQQFTDARGAFAVEGALAPDGSGDVGLWAVAAGYDFGKARVARPPEGPMAPITIVLSPKAGVVTVRVRDGEARPVAGAIVGRPRTYPLAVTDAQGLASCDPTFFPEGERKAVRVVAAGFALAWGSLEEVPNEGPLDVVLERARGLDVRVVDADGKPVVAELLVGRGAVDGLREQPRALWEDDPRSVARGVTDEDGGVRLEGLPPTVTTLVARESRVATNEVVVKVAGDATQVEIRLPSRREDEDALASVEGEIVDGDGKPASTWQLSLIEDGVRSYTPVQSGSRFRFGGVRPGAYRLQGWVVGTTVPIGRRLTLSAGQEMTGLRLTPPRPATLIGTLRGDGLGEGGHLQAVAVPAEAYALGVRDEGIGADGRFELPQLGPGAYRLVVRVRAPTGSERPLRVADGEFTIEEGATLARTFDVVPAARLWLRCEDDRFADGPSDMRYDPSNGPGSKYEATRWSSVVVRDPSGRQAWSGWLLHGRHPLDTGLPPGRYRVTVNAVKLGAFEGEVDVPATGDVEIEIALSPPPAR